MNRTVSLVFLILLIAADACLKNYVLERFPFLAWIAVCVLFACIVYFFLFFRTNSDNNWDSFEPAVSLSARQMYAIAAILVLAGAFLRFWKISSMYEGLFLDEAYNGLDAIAIREYGARPIFLAWNSGREALVAYLDAFSTLFFGYTGAAIRAVTAFAGTLTLMFFYLFVRRLFQPSVALLSLFLLAFSKYAILYNRFGLRFNLMLLFEVASLYFLARGAMSEKTKWFSFVLAGVCAGIGFHTYIPYRIFPIVLLAFIVDRSVRMHLRRHVTAIGVALVICGCIATPLAYHYWKNPEDFGGRIQKTAIWSKQKQPLPAVLAESTRDTVALFTYRSDPNPRHNVREEPGLSPFITPFFVLGLTGVCARIGSAPFASFLLIYFFVTIIPGILGSEAPHASRVLGALPPAIVFAALGIARAWKIVNRMSRALAKLFLGVVLGGVFITGPNDALFRYAREMDAQPPSITALWGMDSVEVAAAAYMNRMSSTYEMFASPQLFLHATVQYLTHGRADHRLYTEDVEFPRGKISLVMLQLTTRNMWWLRDDDSKNFYHWWNVRYGLDPSYLRSIVRRYYVSYPRTTRFSDERILQNLRDRYPEGKTLDFANFSVFMVKSD